MKKSLPALIPLALLLAAALACRPQNDVLDAPAHSVPKTSIPAGFKIDDAARFGTGASAASEGGAPLAFKKPDGWTQIAAAQFRDINFKLDAVPGGEAYVTLLGGGGGGLESNLNRWRSQFGLPAFSPAEIAALPRLTVMGQPAVMLDLSGAYGGMPAAGEAPKENWRLVGAMLSLPMTAITVKMTGPAAALEAELPHFKDFVQSLTMAPPGAAVSQTAGAAQASAPLFPLPGAGAGQAAPNSAPAAAASGIADGIKADEAGLAWTLPSGWSEADPGPVRLASLKIAGSPQLDVSLSMLGGNGGGKEQNVGRWHKQFALPEPPADAIARLPTIKILGLDSTLVEISGAFTDMAGNKIDNAALIAAICEMPGQALFIKMTGPADAVKAQRDAFLAFCASIKKK